MTGRERIQAAFDPNGSPEIGAVIAYDGIFVRDHYAALTSVPWWRGYADAGADVAADVIDKTGLDWLAVDACPSREERERYGYEQRADGVWRIDGVNGAETLLKPPMVGGTNTDCATSRHVDPESLPETREAIDALIPRVPPFDRPTFLAEGRQDRVAAIRASLPVFLYGSVSAPLWRLYGLFGYEGMMLFMAGNPELAAYAGRRLVENTLQRIRMLAALGVDGVWIEECLVDQIDPGLYRDLDVPLVRRCVEEIRSASMKSIYYYCGNPNDRLASILEVGADAVHFEESKKNFKIEINDLIEKIDGRCVVFGNLDAVNVLERGDETQLRAAIRRQIDAGRRGGGRFIASTGSPVTPGTSWQRVRLYTDITHSTLP